MLDDKIQVLSQNQDLCNKIDWLEIYDNYLVSKLSQRAFYAVKFPSLLSKYDLDGYVPAMSTLHERFAKIRLLGREHYIRNNRDRSNQKFWYTIYDAFLASGKSLKHFCDENDESVSQINSNTMYSHLARIRRVEYEKKLIEAAQNKAEGSSDNTVKVVNLELFTELTQTESTQDLQTTSFTPTLPIKPNTTPSNISPKDALNSITLNFGKLGSIVLNTTDAEFAASALLKLCGK